MIVSALRARLLGNPLRVAVCAGDGVDVVPALGREVRRVHLLDFEATVGVGGVAGAARRPGGIVVGRMAVQAAQALVHAGGRVVVR